MVANIIHEQDWHIKKCEQRFFSVKKSNFFQLILSDAEVKLSATWSRK